MVSRDCRAWKTSTASASPGAIGPDVDRAAVGQHGVELPPGRVAGHLGWVRRRRFGREGHGPSLGPDRRTTRGLPCDDGRVPVTGNRGNRERHHDRRQRGHPGPARRRRRRPPPHLPAVRGDVRARDHRVADGTVGAHPRRSRQRVQPAASSAPRARRLHQLHEDPDRLRAPRRSAGATIRPRPRGRRSRGTRPSPRSSRGPHAASSTQPRPRRGGHLPRQPERRTPWPADALQRAPWLKALGSTQPVLGLARSTRCPSTCRAGCLFGNPLLIPVPDLDRTDYLLMLGANPCESNGSLCTAPDFPGRLKAIQARGGKVVVVDPRRTQDRRGRRRARGRSAPAPTPTCWSPWPTCCSPRTSSTSATLAATRRRRRRAAGRWSRRSPPRRSRPITGIDADTIRRLARELAAAPQRGASTGASAPTPVDFGTLASWAVDVLNVLTGNLDRPGGAMFPLPAHEPRHQARAGPGLRHRAAPQPGQGPPRGAAASCPSPPWPTRSRPRARARSARSSPSPATRSMSTPNAGRLDAALGSLDFMVSVDIYLNETTRHANVILPPPSPLERSDYAPRLLRPGRAQRRQLVAAAVRQPTARGAPGPRPAGADRSAARAPTPTRRSSTTC